MNMEFKKRKPGHKRLSLARATKTSVGRRCIPGFEKNLVGFKSPFESLLIERLDAIQDGVSVEVNYSTLTHTLTIYYLLAARLHKQAWSDEVAKKAWQDEANQVVQATLVEVGLILFPEYDEIYIGPAPRGYVAAGILDPLIRFEP